MSSHKLTVQVDSTYARILNKAGYRLRVGYDENSHDDDFEDQTNDVHARVDGVDDTQLKDMDILPEINLVIKPATNGFKYWVGQLQFGEMDFDSPDSQQPLPIKKGQIYSVDDDGTATTVEPSTTDQWLTKGSIGVENRLSFTQLAVFRTPIGDDPSANTERSNDAFVVFDMWPPGFGRIELPKDPAEKKIVVWFETIQPQLALAIRHQTRLCAIDLDEIPNPTIKFLANGNFQLVTKANLSGRMAANGKGTGKAGHQPHKHKGRLQLHVNGEV